MVIYSLCLQLYLCIFPYAIQYSWHPGTSIITWFLFYVNGTDSQEWNYCVKGFLHFNFNRVCLIVLRLCVKMSTTSIWETYFTYPPVIILIFSVILIFSSLVGVKWWYLITTLLFFWTNVFGQLCMLIGHFDLLTYDLPLYIMALFF